MAAPAFTMCWLAVPGLVVIDRVGEWHQHRANSRRTELRHRQRTGTADHQISPAVGLCHIADKGLNAGTDSGFVVGRPGHLKILLTALMPNIRAISLRHQRQGPGQLLIEHLGSQASTNNQHP